MATPVIVGSGADRRIAWNVSANVGVSSPNNTLDVQLVQLGYFCAKDRSNFYDAATRSIFAQVFPGASYSGQENDPLTRAIRAQEKARGGPQDGHVSVMSNLTTQSYDGGTHGYLIVRLSNLIMFAMRRDFPRIDKHPMCPPLLRAFAINACVR